MKTICTFLLSSFLVLLLAACQAEQEATQPEQTDQAEPPAGEPGSEFPLIPLQQLMAQASFTVPQISPDGRQISYIAPLDNVPNLFVADIDDLDSARALTHFTDSGVRGTDVSGQVMYRWSFDSKRIIYPKDYGGDEHWDIHVVDVETGEDRNLTPLPEKEVSIIAYGRSHPDEALITIEDFGKSNPDVYRLNLDSGERTLVQENDGSLAYVADNNLDIRLSVSFNAEGGLDFYRFGEDGEGDLIYQVAAEDLPALTSAVYQKIIRFDADNENLYLYDARLRDKAALVALNMESGDLQVLAEDDRVDIGGVIYSPIDNEVQGFATNWDRTHWTAIDEDIAADLAELDRLEEGDWRILGRSDDDSTWIVEYMAADKPITFYRYNRASKSGERLFSSTPQLEGLPLSDMHPFVYTTDDGLQMVSYITLPPWTDPDGDGRPDEPVPVVAYIHGGPSDERALYAFGPIVHWLANRGYGFLFLNFRGSAGFGKAYMNAQKLEWGGKMHQDVLDQVEWAIEQGIADPDKVAILGGSYGGYETLVAMTMTPDVFACGIDIVGPSNLEIFMPHWDEDRMGETIGDPRTEEGRAFLRSRSPINFAHQTRNPVLIAQGANDSRVPQEQSDTVVQKMQEAGAEVTYAVYPDEGHGFLRPANSMAFYAIIEVFLHECLGGRYEPITDQIEGSSVEVPVGAEHIPGLPEALAARTDTGLPETEVAEVDDAVLQSYAGQYLLQAYDVQVTVSWDGENLLFEMPGQPVTELLPRSDTEFYISIAPTTFSFHVNEDGSVSHMVLTSDGVDTRMNRVD